MIKFLLMILIQKLVCISLRDETINREVTTQHSIQTTSNAPLSSSSSENSSFSIFSTVFSSISSSTFVETTIAPFLTSSYSSLIATTPTVSTYTTVATTTTSGATTNDLLPNITTGNYDLTTYETGANSTALPPETGTGMFDKILASNFEGNCQSKIRMQLWMRCWNSHRCFWRYCNNSCIFA